MAGKSVSERTDIDRKTLAFLGIRMKDPNTYSLDRVIHRGFSIKACRRVRDMLHLSKQEMAEYLGIRPGELSRIENISGRLSLVPSDRLYRLTRLIVLAMELFNTEQDTAIWLRSPQISFGGPAPFDMLMTEPGAVEVENLIVRMEHGVIS